MYTQNVTINNEVGLHARPATFFIQKANEFKSGIWLEKDERRVNAKSLLGVLSLGIVKGTTITLLADGADEKGSRDRSVRAGFQQFRRITNNPGKAASTGSRLFSILPAPFDRIYYYIL